MNQSIRKLTRKDRKTLTGLILKFVEKTGRDELIKMVPATGEKPEQEKTEEQETKDILNSALNLFKEMLEVIESDITVWFADLLGVTIEEYDEMDIDIELDVISQLLASEKFKSFFSKGLQLRKQISDFASRLRK